MLEREILECLFHTVYKTIGLCYIQANSLKSSAVTLCSDQVKYIYYTDKEIQLYCSMFLIMKIISEPYVCGHFDPTFQRKRTHINKFDITRRRSRF